MLYADMQDPPEVIPQFIEKREKGYKIVTGIKSKSKENPLMYAIRETYYKLLSKISETEHIKQFEVFGLYDVSFVKLLRNLRDSMSYLRGLIAEYGCKRTEVQYMQRKRKAGKSNFIFMRCNDLALLGITSSSKVAMCTATFLEKLWKYRVLSIDDVVKAYLGILENIEKFKINKYYHFEVGTGVETSLKEFAHCVKN